MMLKGRMQMVGPFGTATTKKEGTAMGLGTSGSRRMMRSALDKPHKDRALVMACSIRIGRLNH